MRVVLAVTIAIVAWAAFTWAGGLSGRWSYQALGVESSDFTAEQDGAQVKFYRVMYPTFEGQRYELEHLYKGTMDGERITGKLYVREDGRGDFEPLRTFEGRILGPDRIELDDMPLRRLKSSVGGETAVETGTGSPYKKIIIKRSSGRQEKQELWHAPERKEAGLSSGIPELIKVSGSRDPRAEAALELIRAGDRNFEAKDYRKAAESYARALETDPRKVEALYKLAWSHGALGVIEERAKNSSAAAAHYEKAIEYWKRALRYDPLNRGAMENINRAKRKLEGLKSR